MIHILILVAVFIFLLVLCFPYIMNHMPKKHNNYNTIINSHKPHNSYNPHNPYLESYNTFNTHTSYPFLNSQYGSRRGMSYDLRGDVLIPYYIQLPYNMGTRIPIKNKQLVLVS